MSGRNLLGVLAGMSVGIVGGAEESSVPGPVVKVEKVLGVSTFTLDGEPMTVPCFETYCPTENYFRQFSEAGCTVFSFNTNVTACDYGHSLPTSVDSNAWDYHGFEERCERVLKANPNALLLPRVNLGTPRWWLEAYPEEMEVLDHGGVLYEEPNTNLTVPKKRPFPSLASLKWRRMTSDALHRFIDHVQRSPYGKHIFAYILSGLDTEEWYHWSSGSNQLMGYSVHTQKAFRKWLRGKYGTDLALQKAWNDQEVTLGSAQVPKREERWDLGKGTFRDPKEKMNVIDFYLFYNEIVPETIDHFAGVAKRAVQGRKPIGAFYGYMYEFRGDPEFGHNALERYNQSENLDFLFVTASYSSRKPGIGGDYSRSPAHSVKLHGKLWYHDNDVVSFLAPEVMRRAGFDQGEDWTRNMEVQLDALGYSDTPLGTRWMYRRSFGFALCGGAFESYFDLHGGYYDHPELMDEVALINRAAEASKRFDRSSIAQILVVADEASCSYATFRNRMLGESLLSAQLQLIQIGAPVDHLLLCDLDRLDTSPYKFIIFLNCYQMTDAERATIKRKLLGKGRYILWCYAQGYFRDTERDVDLISDMTAMNMIHPREALIGPRVHFRPEGGDFAQALQEGCGDIVGPEEKLCEAFYVKDDTAFSLGVLPGTEHVTLAVKDMGDWTSIYAISPLLPAAFYRELAKRAGVHLFNDRDDTLYANASYVCLHANGEGERTLRLPRKSRIVDIMSQQVLAEERDSYSQVFQNGETLIVRWTQ